jgi:hypothetical protein
LATSFFVQALSDLLATSFFTLAAPFFLVIVPDRRENG